MIWENDVLLSRTRYFVKEHVGVLKLTDTYDILDPETQQRVGFAKDEPPGWAKFARLLLKKQFLPTTINVYETESSPPVLSLRKKPGFLRTSVVVVDATQAEIGRFQKKLVSLGGGFLVFDTTGQQVADVKGDWKSWIFRLLDNSGVELGVVTKTWAGAGTELFTTADNYMISLSPGVDGSGGRAALLLAAGLAVDTVFREA
jgi:Scramblase